MKNLDLLEIIEDIKINKKTVQINVLTSDKTKCGQKEYKYFFVDGVADRLVTSDECILYTFFTDIRINKLKIDEFGIFEENHCFKQI